MQTADIPDTDSAQDLFFVKHFGDRQDGYDILMNFSKQYKGLSPLINLYTILCVTCLGWCGNKVTVDDATTKLNLATFL